MALELKAIETEICQWIAKKFIPHSIAIFTIGTWILFSITAIYIKNGLIFINPKASNQFYYEKLEKKDY